MTETEQILTELAQQIILNNLRHLNQSIEDFNNLLSRDPDLALKNLSMLSKEDQQTPPVIIEKMIDRAGWRLPDGMLDTTKNYLDPCCGRGGILAYLHKHYNVPKENLYGIDIKQENVILCTKLGFNVIKGNALEQETYVKVENLIKQIKGDSMAIIDRVLMNPPYNGNLHLEILDATLKTIRAINPNAEIASIQPVRWLEDPLAKYKQKSDYKTFKTSIVDKISSLSLISTYDACAKFNILLNGDLGIYVFNNKIANEINCYTSIAQAVVNKVVSKLTISLADKVEANKLEGIRCEIKKLVPTVSYNDTGNAISRMQTSVKLFYGPYVNGYNLNNVFWSEDRMKNQFTKAVGSPFPNSLSFTDLLEANNFITSVTTNFYKNLIHLFKLDQNSPLNFLPYMDDYKAHAWTDEDYCKFFGLTEEESEFMCRKIDDYRVKDFINYINLDEE